MTTFILVCILILLVTGGRSNTPTPRRSWGDDLNDQAQNRLDHSNPIANNIRQGWDNQ